MSGAEQPEVLECIARAAEKAGDDDRAFMRYLAECHAAAAGRNERALRGRSLPVRDAADGTDRTPKSQVLLSDLRFLRNARELARRTLGGTRVIGGTPVARNEYLDCVAVGRDDKWGCTGTFIAPDVVLTAGHCADFATRVFFGNDVTKGGRTVSVAEGGRHRHPEYRPSDHHNDLMVLVLAERVTNIAPRRVADRRTVDAATDGRVVGFGNTDPHGREGYGVKRQVDIAVASPSCQGATDGLADSARYGCHAGLEFVAGKPLLKKDSCTGDSGGPFYVERAGEWLLAGATSRMTNGAKDDCGDGGIYVRVERYLPWIQQLLGVTLT